MSVPHDEKTINLAYKSKYNHKRKNQVVLLMITDGKKHHYIALKSERTDDGFNRPTKSLSKVFRGIPSNHDGESYIHLEQIMRLKNMKDCVILMFISV